VQLLELTGSSLTRKRCSIRNC